MTPALKEYEERVLSAAERIEQRERELFETLRVTAGGQIARLQQKLQRKHEVLSELMEEHIKLKKGLGGL